MQNAFEVLSDADTREVYDAQMREKRAVERIAFDMFVEEMDFDEAEGEYVKKCRCGEQFKIAEDELVAADGGIEVSCSGCSLKAIIRDG